MKAAAAGNKALVFGLSQGGHSALFAGELAASYAPELHVLGTAAVAPGKRRTILGVPRQVNGSNGLVVTVVEAFHAAYPQFDPAAVLTPEALAQAPLVDEKCDFVENYPGSPNLVLAHNPLDIPAMAAILHTNAAGNRPDGHTAARRPGNRRSRRAAVPHRRVREQGLRGR